MSVLRCFEELGWQVLRPPEGFGTTAIVAWPDTNRTLEVRCDGLVCQAGRVS